jgi:hypothetical protein
VWARWISSLGEALAPTTLLDRLLGGRTCQGPRGSLARQVQHALNVLGPGANTLAVTDRRLLLLRREITLGTGPPELTLVWTAPRGVVVDARRWGRGLLGRVLGRVRLNFSDGSWIVLAMPLFGTLRPARTATALTT